MQVLGNSQINEIAEQVAGRANLREVREWARKAVARHIRKTERLLSPVPDHKTLSRLMDADRIPTEAAQRIMIAFKGGEKVYMPSKDIRRKFVTRAVDTMDWINSLVDGDRRIRRIERMSWLEADAQSEAWHQALAKARKTTTGLLSGTRKIMDLSAGGFVVELESKAALQAEGSNMGHCVGGYWGRVEAGQTRIVSIRDAQGHPHVTIELGAPPTVEVKGLGKVTVARVPTNGVQHLIETRKDWNAVQVRGKQNEVPVPRWLSATMEYLEAHGMVWAERGYRAAEVVVPAGAPLVFSVDGVHYADPVEAMEEGEKSVLANLKRGYAFKSAYENSGLSQIHSYLASERPAAVEEFLNAAMPICLGRMKKIAAKGDGGGLQKAIRESGVSHVMKALSRIAPESAVEQRREFLRMAAESEAKEVVTESKPLIEVPGGKGLDVVVHRVPFTSLMLLAGGMTEGIEMEAIARVRPHLDTVLKRIAAQPAAIHSIVPAEGGSIPTSDVHKAFLVSGLAMDYDKATKSVDAGIRGARSALIHGLKQARAKNRIEIGEYNRAMNSLADGFEGRLERLALESVRGTPFFVGAIPPRPAARPSLRRDDPVKTFKLPAQSRVALAPRMR